MLRKKSKTAWNEEHQTQERNEVRQDIARAFKDIVGDGQKTIFSLTSAEANCVRVFEQKNFFPDATFVTTEHVLAVFKNIEHPKVTKYFGDIKRFCSEQNGKYNIDAAWLDYTNGFTANLAGISSFVKSFFHGNIHALAITFKYEEETQDNLVAQLQNKISSYQVTPSIFHVEKDKNHRKMQMAFIVLELRQI